MGLVVVKVWFTSHDNKGDSALSTSSASHPLQEDVLQIPPNDRGIKRRPPTQITKDVTCRAQVR